MENIRKGKGEKMKENRKQKGVTLIALVITIIVLIILAGVSLNLVFGENGIIGQAKEAKKKTEVASEEEAISLALLSINLKENAQQKPIGIPLYDKNLENGSRWNLIILKDTHKQYGTGWYFVEKGTHLEDYGTLKSAWVMNPQTGEKVELADASYNHISYDTALAVKEGLIFNLDPSVVENVDIERLKQGDYSQLGENVELLNFNWDDNSGFTPSAFHFDGVDDYIKLKYNNAEEKQTLAQNGFTFEYYGTIEKGNSYNEKKEPIQSAYTGIFCYWNGEEDKQAKYRFGFESIRNTIKWNAATVNQKSDFSEENFPWNIHYPITDYTPDKELYVTITLDTSNSFIKDGVEYYKQTFYRDGEVLYEGGYNKKQWDAFIHDDLDNLQYFCIGRSSMSGEGWWHYSKMNAYTLRLYSQALSREQIQENYEKSKLYHESLQ